MLKGTKPKLTNPDWEITAQTYLTIYGHPSVALCYIKKHLAIAKTTEVRKNLLSTQSVLESLESLL